MITRRCRVMQRRWRLGRARPVQPPPIVFIQLIERMRRQMRVRMAIAGRDRHFRDRRVLRGCRRVRGCHFVRGFQCARGYRPVRRCLQLVQLPRHGYHILCYDCLIVASLMHFTNCYWSSVNEFENGKDERDLSNYPMSVHLRDV